MVNKTCKSKLNASKLFHAINEHAISQMNHYELFELKDYGNIDNSIKKILKVNQIHC